MKNKWWLLLFLAFFNAKAFAYDKWDKDAQYNVGDIVESNGVVYVSTHWNQGTQPVDNDNKWDGWIKLNETNPEWNADTTYTGGDIVAYNGDIYLSKQWNKKAAPNVSGHWIKIVGNVKPVDPPTEKPDPESKEAILGKDTNKNGISDEFETIIAENYSSEGDIKLASAAAIQWRLMTEVFFSDEPISKKFASDALYESSFIYSCIYQKKKADRKYISVNRLYFTTIDRSAAYRKAQVKLLEANNHERPKEVSEEDCAIYD
ncbi:carbohydrate-binding protein [Photobacterium sp. DNB23_23_1]